MPEVTAASVSPTWVVPLMLGAPVGGVFGGGAATTAPVGSLVNDSSWPSSSVKVTRTLMVLPSSSEIRVKVELLAPAITAPSASHW